MKVPIFFVVLMTGACLQSCHNDKFDYNNLSLNDFKTIVVDNLHKWDQAPENQIIGAIYSQEQQYLVFMPLDSCKVHFYDNNMKFLYSRVSVGQGPGEFVDPLYCGQWEKNDSGQIKSSIFDTSRECISDVSPQYNGSTEIAKLPSGNDLSPVFMVSDPDNKYLYGVSSYMSCALGHGVMFKYDIDTNEFDYKLPTFNVENHNNVFYLMQKGTAVSSDCQILLNTYLYEPIIELWDSDLNLIKAWQLDDTHLVDADFNYENATSFFRGAQIGEKYIYILYYGRPYMQPGESYILAFDHAYNPAFKIDIGNSYWFAINESTNTIIMLRLDENDEPTTYIATIQSQQ